MGEEIDKQNMQNMTTLTELLDMATNKTVGYSMIYHDLSLSIAIPEVQPS